MAPTCIQLFLGVGVDECVLEGLGLERKVGLEGIPGGRNDTYY